MASPVFAQPPVPTREEEIIAAQKAKAGELKPPKVGRVEAWVNRFEDALWAAASVGTRSSRVHTPAADSPSAPGTSLTSAATTRIDLRGSITPLGYKRIEAEFLAPRLFDRRGVAVGIGRVARSDAESASRYRNCARQRTIVPTTRLSSRMLQAVLDVRPTRRFARLHRGCRGEQWDQGRAVVGPSVEKVYTPATLPGLGAKVTYLHPQGSAGLDWRSAPATQDAAATAVTRHDFADTDDQYGFRRRRVRGHPASPVLRDTWVLSLHGRVETTSRRRHADIPFFMLPALGGGSTLRGFSQLALPRSPQPAAPAEWRVLVNRFLDTAVFYDAGKVARDSGTSISTGSRATTASASDFTGQRRHRCASSWRRATRDWRSCSRQGGFLRESHAHGVSQTGV